jgi:hypothetical protein
VFCFQIMLTRHGPLIVLLVDVKFLKEKMAGYPGGCTMILEGRLHSTGQDLVAIGDKYSNRKKSKVVNFIMHPEFGSMKDGVPGIRFGGKCADAKLLSSFGYNYHWK